jgi:hypothetical protein
MRNITACVKFGPSQHYQRKAFESGLSVLGFEIVDRPLVAPLPGDLLVLWNRYSRDEQEARTYERTGGTVLIAENAWIGPEAKSEHHFAICRGHHNGAGSWHVGPTARYQVTEIQPWRANGEHILLLPQRGMGESGVAMPKGWLEDTWNRIAMLTDRPIIFRKHPGVRPHPTEIPEFKNCWAAVTWASGSGLKAIFAGIPVFYEFPKWIGGCAARYGFDDLENPYLGERQTLMRYLSWAQWTAEEIASGVPFRWLVSLSYSAGSSERDRRFAPT